MQKVSVLLANSEQPPPPNSKPYDICIMIHYKIKIKEHGHRAWVFLHHFIQKKKQKKERERKICLKKGNSIMKNSKIMNILGLLIKFNLI